MTDLKNLLDVAAGDVDLPTTDVVGDDVRRGRSALRRRSGGLALAAVAIAALATFGANTGIDALSDRTAVDAPGAQTVPQNPGVQLVAFDAGPTPKPISPGLIPKGWTVSGTETALVISAPADDSDVNDFRGKLVVLLEQQIPNEALPTDHPIAVGDRTGYQITVDPSAMQLFLPHGKDDVVRAQAPLSLHWDIATLAEFLDRVTVSKDATTSLG